MDPSAYLLNEGVARSLWVKVGQEGLNLGTKRKKFRVHTSGSKAE